MEADGRGAGLARQAHRLVRPARRQRRRARLGRARAPEWGRFKLGHTHPDYSNSGVLAVLAEAYAGAKKTRGLTVADLAAPETAGFVASVENTIVHYGKSTGFFADKMIERGPAYLSAAVLYENLVIESYAKNPPFPLVAIYPVEGTFWSDHPYSVLDADWVGAEEREAAELFLAFLKARPAQERALALGFRPGDPAIATTAPIDAAHGVDPKQPSTLLEVPDAPVLQKLLALWRENKKPADVILVFDKSGSMRGAPLEQAKAGGKAFLDTLHDQDQVSLVFFDGTVYPPIGPSPLGPNRRDFATRIDQVYAEGGTAMYDAVAMAHASAAERARTERDRIHAVVVMTDGMDESSRSTSLDRLVGALGGDGDEAAVRVFTIGYGARADVSVLARIAEAAKGATASGDVQSIVSVFQDMGSFL
ncbi:MAG: VWA domain-containing protein [Deltaproteobacteria bacterium]|nr:VWA domain-containing protein [Deltaproteobacteria bacterium]